jgi:general secretion pathway protein L
MAEYLVIRLGNDADQPADWIAVDSSGSRLGPPVTGALTDARADVRDRRVLVLVPGADVLTTTVDIPVKGSRLQAALPYALEETLADDVDHLHFAAGTRHESGRLPVGVVNRERLDEWLSRLRDAGIEPAQVIAEQHGVARIPGTVSLLLDREQILLNDGADTVLALQDMTPGDALVAIGALPEPTAAEPDEADENAAQPAHVLIYCEAADDERFRHDWIALRHELASLDVKLLPDGVLPRLAATVATGTGVNLLQGEYGPKKEYGGLFAPWRYAATLLIGLVLLSTVAKGVNNVVLSREEAALREQFHAEYQQIVPGAPEVDDPVRLVASLRTRAGGSNNGSSQVLLQALQALSTAMRDNSDARIEAVSFRGGVADIRLNASSVSVLDSIRQRVSADGNFEARIQSTDQVGDRVNSRIQIQAVSP